MDGLFPGRIHSPEIYSKVMWFTTESGTNFEAYIKSLNRDVHLVAPDVEDHDPQLFVVIDNNVIMELI
ncbi:hypothetical protein ACROYT_G014099 [Oculina patagonica]